MDGIKYTAKSYNCSSVCVCVRLYGRVKESIWWAMASLAASRSSNTSSPGSLIPYFITTGLQPESSRVCSSASASIWPEVVLAALARTL